MVAMTTPINKQILAAADCNHKNKASLRNLIGNNHPTCDQQTSCF
jgi:hypothetical protein